MGKHIKQKQSKTLLEQGVFKRNAAIVLTALLVLPLFNTDSTYIREMEYRGKAISTYGIDAGYNEDEDIKTSLTVEESRQFGTINTYTFTIDNDVKESLSMESVSNILTEYLYEHKFEVEAVGFVDNKFYIQLNTAKPVEYNTKIQIVSIKDSFNANDWFSLTEAVYNSLDVKADSAFTYITNSGNKHYIYAYED